MKTQKAITSKQKPTGEQILKQKITEMSILVKNTDFSKLPKRQN